MARVMLFNGKDWAPLDWDVPAEEVKIDQVINAPTILELKIPAEYNAQKHGGFPLAYRDMTHVVVEDDGGSVYAGIIRESPLTDTLTIVAHGHSSYASQTPWKGKRVQWTGLDSVTAFRRVWANITGNANIPRLELRGATTGGTKVGRPASAKWVALTSKINSAAKFIKTKENKVSYWEKQERSKARAMFKAAGRTTVGEVATKGEKPTTQDAATGKAVIEEDKDKKVVAVHFWNWKGIGGGSWTRRATSSVIEAARKWRTTKASLDRSKEAYPTYVQRHKEWTEQLERDYPNSGPEPYEVSWWGNRDLSTTLNELADLGDFYWYDTCRWVGDEPRPGIEIVTAKRAIRQDIHLEVGINIHETIAIRPQEVATHITAIGSGEGATTLKAERSMSHARLVPVHKTISNKDHRTQQLVNRAADAELARSRKALTPSLEGLTITDHPLAPISSFRLGDRIRVVGTLRDGSDLDAVVRVIGLERDLAGKTLAVKVEGD